MCIYLIHPVFFNSCRRLLQTKRHSSLFLHSFCSKFPVVMAACTPSISVFLGRLHFLLSRGIHSIINFGILSSGILLTWSYRCSLFWGIINTYLRLSSAFQYVSLVLSECLLDPEGNSVTIFRNVGNYLPSVSVSHHRRLNAVRETAEIIPNPKMTYIQLINQVTLSLNVNLSISWYFA